MRQTIITLLVGLGLVSIASLIAGSGHTSIGSTLLLIGLTVLFIAILALVYGHLYGAMMRWLRLGQ